MWFLQLSSSPAGCFLAVKSSLRFHVNFRTSLSVSTKNHWDFGGDCIESMIALESINNLKILSLLICEHGIVYIISNFFSNVL